MKPLSSQENEFLSFVFEELTEIEHTGFGIIREAELRVLSSRLRNLLHPTEGSLLRAFSILSIPLNIIPEHVPFLYTSHDRTSPAVYAVEFRDFLTQTMMDDFGSSHVSQNQYVLIYPLIGFDRKASRFVDTDAVILKDYLDAPLFGVDGVLISRWQVISYLSNKKGLSHYSDSRGHKWQKVLDTIWEHRISNNNSSESIRMLYEAVQRIANEVLYCTKPYFQIPIKET